MLRRYSEVQNALCPNCRGPLPDGAEKTLEDAIKRINKLCKGVCFGPCWVCKGVGVLGYVGLESSIETWSIQHHHQHKIFHMHAMLMVSTDLSSSIHRLPAPWITISSNARAGP